MKSVAQLKDLPTEVQVQVLALHDKTFKDSACSTCDGNCCTRCAKANGFFRMPKASLDELKARFGFDDKDGFRGPTGCKLPREERNDICLSFMCSGLVPFDHVGKRTNHFGPPADKPFTDEQRANGYAISEAFFVDSKPGSTKLKDVWPSHPSVAGSSEPTTDSL